jgi:two-component system cell cycle response regulator
VPPPFDREFVLKVLIADDDAGGRQVLEVAVSSLGYACAVASDGEQAWEMHQAHRADVVLADWTMPRLDGIGLCQRIRGAEPSVPYTQFFFVTGHNDKAHFIEAMQAGADDYLTKPVDLDQLGARLEVARRAVMLRRDGDAKNTALRRKSDKNFRAARTDPLTAVSNRLELAENLAGLAARVDQYGHTCCAALCDIDFFKAYNDRFGHLAGDEVLRQTAHAIRLGLRREDLFYRYGGEEFLAILPEQSLQAAAAGMDRVRRVVENLHVVHAPAAHVPFVTISVGIAELSSNSTGGIEGWLRRADTALYLAKAEGRNRVTVERPDAAHGPPVPPN